MDPKTNEAAAPVSRFAYTTYSDTAKGFDERITEYAKELEIAINRAPSGREKALALTKLEESVMWARKALREVG